MSELNSLSRHILNILSAQRGPEARMLRGELLEELQLRMVDVAHREMRAAIEELRKAHPRGAWICADMRGGYFMARDEEELDRYLQSDEKRAAHLLQRVRIQRAAAGLQSSSQLELL